MGNLGLHDGVTFLPGGSTLDIVPRNFEFCIDGRPFAFVAPEQGRLVECDPAWVAGSSPNPSAIPIYLVRDACVGFTLGTTPNPNSRQFVNVLIRLTNENGCARLNQAEDRLIVLTHLVLDNPALTLPDLGVTFPIPLTSGTRLGSICLSSQAYDPNCSMAQPNTPTHLAFQLQIIGSNGLPQQSPNGVLGYLARMGCLYDTWASTNGAGAATQMIAAQVQTNPVRACP
jgi:hypothetical protein